jgi:hypothetical protein
MRTILMGAAAVATLALGMQAQAAERCSDVVRTWESTVSRYPTPTAEREANGEYRRAKDALRQGDNEACLGHMGRAARIMREESARADDRRYSDRRYDDEYDRRGDERRTEGSGSSNNNALSDIIRNLGNNLGR